MPQDNKDNDGRLRSRPVNRRNVLKLGAATAIIPAVIEPPSLVAKTRPAAVKSIVDRELPTGPFSVGYWSGDPDSSLMSARSLSEGDQQFARYGAKIEMLGMCPVDDPDSCAKLQSLAIDISLSPAPYRAWRFENTSVRNVSSPAAFTVPVDGAKGLVFRVDTLTKGLKGRPKSGGFRLSLGSESSVAKLQSGYYIVAIGETGRGFRVNWGSYTILGDDSGQSTALYRNGKIATDFPYVLFTVSLNEDTGVGYI